VETPAKLFPARVVSSAIGFSKGWASSSASKARKRPQEIGGAMFLLASNGFRGLAGLPHGLCALLPVEDTDAKGSRSE